MCPTYPHAREQLRPMRTRPVIVAPSRCALRRPESHLMDSSSPVMSLLCKGEGLTATPVMMPFSDKEGGCDHSLLPHRAAGTHQSHRARNNFLVSFKGYHLTRCVCACGCVGVGVGMGACVGGCVCLSACVCMQPVMSIVLIHYVL